MNSKFEELTNGMAKSLTRRTALTEFGLGLAGMVLACFGLAGKAAAGSNDCNCTTNADCKANYHCNGGSCIPNWCVSGCCCFTQGRQCLTAYPTCNANYSQCATTCAGNFQI